MESKWSLIYREMKVFSVIDFWSQFYKSFFCFDFEYHMFALSKCQTERAKIIYFLPNSRVFWGNNEVINLIMWLH